MAFVRTFSANDELFTWHCENNFDNQDGNDLAYNEAELSCFTSLFHLSQLMIEESERAFLNRESLYSPQLQRLSNLYQDIIARPAFDVARYWNYVAQRQRGRWENPQGPALLDWIAPEVHISKSKIKDDQGCGNGDER